MVECFFDVYITDKKFHKASVYAELVPNLLLPTDEEVEVDLNDINFALDNQCNSCIEGTKIRTTHSQFILHEIVKFLR